MRQKKSENDLDCESETLIGWDHPLCRAGFVPGHLLREAFGYSVGGWSLWCSQHPQLVKTMNRQAWFNLDRFIAWTALPENAADLPPKDEPKPAPRKKAQRGHN